MDIKHRHRDIKRLEPWHRKSSFAGRRSKHTMAKKHPVFISFPLVPQSLNPPGVSDF